MRNKTLISMILVALVLAASVITYYNNMVRNEETVNRTWAQVQTVMQRRFDLIGNLVNSVKGYIEHEKDVLIAVTKARNNTKDLENNKLTDIQEKEKVLSQAMTKLYVVMENYPNLKADQTFIVLMAELEGTENRISIERQRYNEAVTQFNIHIKKLPGKLLAGLFGFSEKDLFKSTSGAEQKVEVKF